MTKQLTPTPSGVQAPVNGSNNSSEVSKASARQSELIWSRLVSVLSAARLVWGVAQMFSAVESVSASPTRERSRDPQRRRNSMLALAAGVVSGAAVVAFSYILKTFVQARGQFRISSTPPRPARVDVDLAAKSLAQAPTAVRKVDANQQKVTISAIAKLAWTAAIAWSDRRASSKGAALALYTLLSLAPILILVLAGAGLFVDPATVQNQLLSQMKGLTGAAGADAVRTILESAHQSNSGAIASIVSALVLLVSATTAFGELKDSLDELWDVKKGSGSGLWGMVRERFLSVGLLMVLALMLLCCLVLSAGLSAVSGLMGDSAATLIGKAGAGLITYLAVCVLFAVIFKFLPAVSISWTDVSIGALLTGGLFLIGKAMIGVYLAHGGVSSAYGAAGSIVALVIWIYYSAQIFFYGSLFTHGYALKYGSRRGAMIQPDGNTQAGPTK